MSNSKCKPLTTTQPTEWNVAAKAQARREGVSLSAWVGQCILANLDADLHAGLGVRPELGRPVKRRAE